MQKPFRLSDNERPSTVPIPPKEKSETNDAKNTSDPGNNGNCPKIKMSISVKRTVTPIAIAEISPANQRFIRTRNIIPNTVAAPKEIQNPMVTQLKYSVIGTGGIKYDNTATAPISMPSERATHL